MTSLKDRVVIVTGGSSGIGRAAASRFATLGAHILITGRRAASVDDAAKDHFNIQSLVADTGEPLDAYRLAGELGLPFAFAAHIASQNLEGATQGQLILTGGGKHKAKRNLQLRIQPRVRE